MPNPTVLIVTETDDQHANIIQKRLRQRLIPVFRLDYDSYTEQTLVWRPGSLGKNIPSIFLPECEVSTVWYRLRRQIPVVQNEIDSFVSQEKSGLFDALLNRYNDSRWINAREHLTRARPKLYQLEVAREVGFKIPDTIVTNNLEALIEFAETYRNDVVVKPIQTQVLHSNDGSLVLGTRKLPKDYFGNVLNLVPCYVQERLVIKYEIRVVTFGTRTYAFKLTASQHVDDLKQLCLNQIKHEPYYLDEETEHKLSRLMAYFGLEFAAVDLAVTDNDELFFLEINPNGQWLWLQYMTQINLEDQFIDFLCQ